MSIFGKIMSSIFGTPAKADEVTPADVKKASEAATASAGTAAPAAPSAAPTASPSVKTADAGTSGGPAPAAPAAAAPAAAAPAAKVDVAAILDKLTDDSDETDIDWRKSIVDLMKLLKIDSGLKARKELAKELGYTGNTSDSATMNVWLHKQVMKKLAENGGKVPADLLKH